MYSIPASPLDTSVGEFEVLGAKLQKEGERKPHSDTLCFLHSLSLLYAVYTWADRGGGEYRHTPQRTAGTSNSRGVEVLHGRKRTAYQPAQAQEKNLLWGEIELHLHEQSKQKGAHRVHI